MIRFAKAADVAAMLEIYRPFVENTAFSFEYSTPDEAEFLRRFQTITEQFPWLVWEENGEILGYAYAGKAFERVAYNWTAEISVYLHPNVHRQGVGRKLYEKLENILKMQGYQVVYALITAENEVSIAFHSAMGYRLIGDFPNSGYKFGKWYGVVWMEKRLNDTAHPTDFPTPFPKLNLRD